MKKTNRTYSWQELNDFIASQKDDRMVNMCDCACEDIGDVLTHFGRKKLKKVVNSVGVTGIFYGKVEKRMFPDTDSNSKVFDFINMLMERNVKDYGQVKNVLRKIAK